MKKPTIKDVAREAGVSVATVSNVINNIDKASAETKERVLKVIQEMNYQPDYTARSLSAKKTNLIGIMLPVFDDGYYAHSLMRDNPFYAEFISGAEHGARKHKYEIMITGLGKEDSYRNWVVKRNLDGLIFLGNYPEKLFDEIDKYGELNIPIALIDCYAEHNSRYYNIGIDDELGGYTATKYLIDMGHKKIAIALSAVEYSGVNRLRFIGYKKALKEAGIEFDKSLVFDNVVSFEGGEKIGMDIINSDKDITAVFAVADIIAFGIMRTYAVKGYNIPDKLSVVGFDDISICKYISPGLTTIRQEIFKKGESAAEAIIKELDTGKKSDRDIIIPVSIIKRESVKMLK